MKNRKKNSHAEVTEIYSIILLKITATQQYFSLILAKKSLIHVPVPGLHNDSGFLDAAAIQDAVYSLLSQGLLNAKSTRLHSVYIHRRSSSTQSKFLIVLFVF